ncbi:response regulator transcription factor [Spirosoma arcticum]
MQFISQLLEHPSLLAYFSGANNYTWLRFRNGERRLLAKPLTYFEERLPTFIRVHKTALINPTCVVGVAHPSRTKMPGTVRMHDGTELPVSRRRWNDVIRLLEGSLDDVRAAMAATPELPPVERKSTRRVLYSPPPLVLLTVMTGDAVLLTRERIGLSGMNCVLQHVEQGAELASALLLSSANERPGLILLDSRTNRPDRMLTLRALKSHPRLRAIPVVWLAAPGEDTTQAYALDANSVVVIPDSPASFKKIIEQLCQYWLTVVQLPPEADAG